MVNYCCVKGCGRSSKLSAHLNYYTLPKEKNRRIVWLNAAGRQDLIDDVNPRTTYRFCSRHFAADRMKTRVLPPDTIPTLRLPNKNTDINAAPVPHHDIVCDGCKNTIIGFRYKCVTCPDYDLCPKCEMLETHAHHYMLRIPKPLKFKIADDLIKKWRSFFKVEHVNPDCEDDDSSGCSSDDEPISKHIERLNENGGDLTDDVKLMIREEVTRVLTLKHDEKKRKKREKRKGDSSLLFKALVKQSKKARTDRTDGPMKAVEPPSSNTAPEVAFADVNAYKEPEVKNEMSTPTASASEGEEAAFGQSLMNVRLSDDLTELMREMSGNENKSAYKYN